MLPQIEKMIKTMNITDKMVAIAVIGAIKELNEISVSDITEKCIPLALKLDELEPTNMVSYRQSVKPSFITEKLTLFSTDGIIKEDVILQFKKQHYYKDPNANFNFFSVPADKLEAVLNNDEKCSKMIEVMRENATRASEAVTQEFDLVGEIKKFRKDLKQSYDRFDKRLEELEIKLQRDA
ncbi:hypothetical protein HNV12_16245 [Methanococcoides sp. SA1]|nr:hypothetical protein [Methanococcoides sp. SA1]